MKQLRVDDIVVLLGEVCEYLRDGDIEHATPLLNRVCPNLGDVIERLYAPRIRLADISYDTHRIYDFGRLIPELCMNASATEFMTEENVLHFLADPRSVAYVAESANADIVGFIFATIGDPDGPSIEACIVYLAVAPNVRRKGLASELYEMCVKELRRRGARSIYAWAHPTSGVVEFLEQRGFRRGEARVWMDCSVE